ncbi:F-box domain-containing protein [Alternaria rosae]|uniref:F-box domain-containing protein n=1 Tax=Alternaria rosae TaxID=1187941 RepID=UPI001E8E61C7|nr:F-box domain-containing protein [Alternaria rosae]KAH6868806.1 F-box domain-containing protein [Alternaria rosae]
MKRAHGGDDDGEHPAKVQRLLNPDKLSRLSEELLVRILSFVPVPSLLVCQRVSKKFSRLSVDSELWKAAYYRTFVLPRASRIPGIRGPANPNRLHYSSRLSKWLEDGYLVKDGTQTNWKQQYRLRHNWTQGQCAVSEIVVAERPPDPPLLVMMSNSIIYAADSMSGLRAWNSKNDRELLASTELSGETDMARLPISMAIDASNTDDGTERVVIGFEDGSFSIYVLRTNRKKFSNLFTHPPSTNGMLSALAYSSPYLLTMTEDHLLSLYAFEEVPGTFGLLEAPKLLYSLRSNTAWPPVSLSLRTTAHTMTAAIAYSLPTYLSGWTVGVQELILSHKGDLIESRLATAADEHSFTLSTYRAASSSARSSSPLPDRADEALAPSGPSRSKPTSMSYSHPYLLVAHPDNTLSLYLVRSTSQALSISSGNRLWGHTSSISGAHVGMRGKAVSVSRRGDELRVWDLEGGMNSSVNRKRSRNGQLSVRVQPSKFGEDNIQDGESGQQGGLRFALDQGFDDSSVSRGWVGFDEQNVIVLREKSEGSQALVVYDFT